MSLELFVALMCFGKYECDYTPRAYYAQNVELQESVKGLEALSKEVIRKYTVKNGDKILFNYLVPAYMATQGYGGSVSIYGPFNVEIRKNYTGLNVAIGF